MAVFVPPGATATGVPGLGPEWTERLKDMDHLAMFGGLVHDEAGGRVRKHGAGAVDYYRMHAPDRIKIANAMHGWVLRILQPVQSCSHHFGLRCYLQRRLCKGRVGENTDAVV